MGLTHDQQVLRQLIDAGAFDIFRVKKLRPKAEKTTRRVLVDTFVFRRGRRYFKLVRIQIHGTTRWQQDHPQVDARETVITNAQYAADKQGIQPFDSEAARAALVEAQLAEEQKIARRAQEVATAPHCPKCGGRMGKRQSIRATFWGCNKYPICRGIVVIAKK